jgi:hypothetical protein
MYSLLSNDRATGRKNDEKQDKSVSRGFNITEICSVTPSYYPKSEVLKSSYAAI